MRHKIGNEQLPDWPLLNNADWYHKQLGAFEFEVGGSCHNMFLLSSQAIPWD